MLAWGIVCLDIKLNILSMWKTSWIHEYYLWIGNLIGIIRITESCWLGYYTTLTMYYIPLCLGFVDLLEEIGTTKASSLKSGNLIKTCSFSVPVVIYNSWKNWMCKQVSVNHSLPFHMLFSRIPSLSQYALNETSETETGAASLKAYPCPFIKENLIRLFFLPLVLATQILLRSYFCFQAIALVMSNWPCSKMAWAPYGRGGVEGVSSSSQKVFGSGRLERNSAAKESSCCPPPPALCCARWRPLDLLNRKRVCELWNFG